MFAETHCHEVWMGSWIMVTAHRSDSGVGMGMGCGMQVVNSGCAMIIPTMLLEF